MAYVMRFAVVILVLVGSAWASAANVSVQGLFKGSAVLSIDGKQRLLKAGSTSPEGVRLISANSRVAVIEVDGQRHELGVSQRIASGFEKAEAVEVRIPSGRGGHFVAAGQINGQPVEFLVDTGATHIAMNRATAERLRINFRAGRQSQASTANGVVSTFVVNLARVTVGGISVDNVAASVHLSGSPSIVLLGNSFLSHLQLKQEDGVLVMSSRQ